LVDATGLFADNHSTTPDPTMWLSDGVGFGGDPGDDGDPEVVFDLGGVYDVGSVRIWNYNEINHRHRGVKDLEILVSLDGVSYDSMGNFTLFEAPGVDNVDYSETLPINASDVQFVKFDILSNYNGAIYPNDPSDYDDNGFVGLSEVRFYSGLVPEPSAVVMLVVGLLGLGWYGWRRRR
jgi:hypothetical protein